LLNIIGDYARGQYMPAMINTLEHAFAHVYLIGALDSWEGAGAGTYVLAATDRTLDLTDYYDFIAGGVRRNAVGNVHDESGLEQYLAARKPVLLTDDYVPTDILVLPLMDEMYYNRISAR